MRHNNRSRLGLVWSSVAIGCFNIACSTPAENRLARDPAGEVPKIKVGYVASVVHKIRSNILYAGEIDKLTNPRVSYLIELLPDGTVTNVVLKQSSGNQSIDEAVRLGIWKASPLPRKIDGTSEPKIAVGVSMK